jgi:hypothetical protein
MSESWTSEEQYEFYKPILIKASTSIKDILNDHFHKPSKDNLYFRRAKFCDYIDDIQNSHRVLKELQYTDNFKLFFKCGGLIIDYYNPLFESSAIQLRAQFESYCLENLGLENSDSLINLHSIVPKPIILWTPE